MTSVEELRWVLINFPVSPPVLPVLTVSQFSPVNIGRYLLVKKTKNGKRKQYIRWNIFASLQQTNKMSSHSRDRQMADGKPDRQTLVKKKTGQKVNVNIVISLRHATQTVREWCEEIKFSSTDWVRLTGFANFNGMPFGTNFKMAKKEKTIFTFVSARMFNVFWWNSLICWLVIAKISRTATISME